MRDYVHLWLSALFLKREAFEYQRDRCDSFAHGLMFILAIAVLVATFGIAGGALKYATEPSADAIKNTVLNHLQAMPFYDQFSPQTERQFLNGYDRAWAIFGSWLVGHPTSPAGLSGLLASLFTTPLLWFMGWIIYGALAHAIAASGNPHNSLSHGLGTLALATSPQVLNLVSILPGASIDASIVGLWTLILNVFALRTAYRITTRRAILSALLPLLLLLFFMILFACVGFSVLAIAIQGVRR